MAWAKNGTPETLSSAEQPLDISDLTSTIFNVTMSYFDTSDDSNNEDFSMRLGNSSLDSGSNYAYRRSHNGAADGTGTSTSGIQCAISQASTAERDFIIAYEINISSEEKLVIGFAIEVPASGATTAPARMEFTGKWANTSNQFDNIGFIRSASANFSADSQISQLGTD